jgi:predicted negative regulator of RcsB-dependent stress response
VGIVVGIFTLIFMGAGLWFSWKKWKERKEQRRLESQAAPAYEMVDGSRGDRPHIQSTY